MKENESAANCGAVDAETGEYLIYKDNKFQEKKRTWVEKLFGLNKPNKMDTWGAAKFYKQVEGVRQCLYLPIFGGEVYRWKERIIIDIFVREHKFTSKQEFWYVKDKRKVCLNARAIKQGIIVEL
jgi:hypothetical protein